MVLESLIGPLKAEKTPKVMFLLGALYSCVAILFSIWAFREQASILMVSITVFACIPLIYRLIRIEEKKDNAISQERKLLSEHKKVLTVFTYLFLGFILTFSLWYIFSPELLLKDLFSNQINTIDQIRNSFTGRVADGGYFMEIFLNNLKVLMFCIIFSFFFGAGAIFILTWNASVISVAIGNFVRTNINHYATDVGLFKVANYFYVFSLGIMAYLSHGIFEIIAYFIGGLAGGIVSVAVIRHEFYHKKFKHILVDSFNLFIIAIIILYIAAVIEAFVTPIFF